MSQDNLYALPPDLPVPQDDGAARHLPGAPVPPCPLLSTGGRLVRLDDPAAALTVVYCYPRTGRPDAIALGGTADWNAIPGARGCTPQSCAYRDRHDDLRRLGAVLFGLSTQTTEYQKEAATRLQLPFELLSDAGFSFTDALRLPTFTVEGVRLLKRLTLLITRGRVRHCFYPVFPPDQDAEKVIHWIREHGA